MLDPRLAKRPVLVLLQPAHLVRGPGATSMMGCRSVLRMAASLLVEGRVVLGGLEEPQGELDSLPKRSRCMTRSLS